MAGLFGTLQRWKAIQEVTSDKDVAPPFYLMKEIADLTRESPDQGASIANQVHQSLENKSPVVKIKALKLVKHLCKEGSPQFLRSMQQHAATIRVLVCYEGKPDPMKGDAPARNVRELAQEALDLLYNNVPSSQGGGTSSIKGRIQGFGNTAPPTPGAAAASRTLPSSYNSSSSSNNLGSSGQGRVSSNRMMGFGNTAFDNPPPPSSTQGYGAPPPSDCKPSASNVSLNNKGSGMFGRLTEPLNHAAASGSPSSGEQAILDTLTQPGGLRAQPPKEDLQQFVEAASCMDGLKMAELMIAKLASDQWQVVLRTLCVLDAVLQSGMTQACGEIAVMFQSDPTSIRAAQTHHHPQVREKASSCLKVLLADSEEPVNMLGNLDEPPAPKLPPPPSSTVPLSSANAAKPEAAGAPPPKDPFDFLVDLEPVLPTSPPPAAPTRNNNPTTTPPPEASTVPPPVASGFDPFATSDLMSSPAPQSNPTPSSSFTAGPTGALADGALHPSAAGPQLSGVSAKPAPPPPLDDFFAAPLAPPPAPHAQGGRGMPGLAGPGGRGLGPGAGVPPGGAMPGRPDFGGPGQRVAGMGGQFGGGLNGFPGAHASMDAGTGGPVSHQVGNSMQASGMGYGSGSNVSAGRKGGSAAGKDSVFDSFDFVRDAFK